MNTAMVWISRRITHQFVDASLDAALAAVRV
jgi:hypothetical protein